MFDVLIIRSFIVSDDMDCEPLFAESDDDDDEVQVLASVRDNFTNAYKTPVQAVPCNLTTSGESPSFQIGMSVEAGPGRHFSFGETDLFYRPYPPLPLPLPGPRDREFLLVDEAAGGGVGSARHRPTRDAGGSGGRYFPRPDRFLPVDDLSARSRSMERRFPLNIEGSDPWMNRPSASQRFRGRGEAETFPASERCRINHLPYHNENILNLSNNLRLEDGDHSGPSNYSNRVHRDEGGRRRSEPESASGSKSSAGSSLLFSPIEVSSGEEEDAAPKKRLLYSNSTTSDRNMSASDVPVATSSGNAPKNKHLHQGSASSTAGCSSIDMVKRESCEHLKNQPNMSNCCRQYRKHFNFSEHSNCQNLCLGRSRTSPNQWQKYWAHVQRQAPSSSTVSRMNVNSGDRNQSCSTASQTSRDRDAPENMCVSQTAIKLDPVLGRPSVQPARLKTESSRDKPVPGTSKSAYQNLCDNKVSQSTENDDSSPEKSSSLLIKPEVVNIDYENVNVKNEIKPSEDNINIKSETITSINNSDNEVSLSSALPSTSGTNTVCDDSKKVKFEVKQETNDIEMSSASSNSENTSVDIKMESQDESQSISDQSSQNMPGTSRSPEPSSSHSCTTSCYNEVWNFFSFISIKNKFLNILIFISAFG